MLCMHSRKRLVGRGSGGRGAPPPALVIHIFKGALTDSEVFRDEKQASRFTD